jgi:hypothetical protein
MPGRYGKDRKLDQGGKNDCRPRGSSNSAHRPSVVARAYADMFAEAPRAMALIRKADRYCYFRKRKVGAGEQLHGTLDPTLDQVVVRRHTFGLLERTGEIKQRQARDAGERVDRDLLAKMRVDIFANPPQGLRRKAPRMHATGVGADQAGGAGMVMLPAGTPGRDGGAVGASLGCSLSVESMVLTLTRTKRGVPSHDGTTKNCI